MNQNRLRKLILMGALVLVSTAQAGTPVWTFAQVSGYPSSIIVSTIGAAIIKYTVTNQSHRSHQLQMQPIQGITPSGCTSPLGSHQSCILTLTVNGSGLMGDVLSGPVLCHLGNPNQCYQPSHANSLAIRVTPSPPVQQYTVTSAAGANGSISPSGTDTVNSGATITFTAISDAGYGVSEWLIDGNLAQMGGTTYLLSNISNNHLVNVAFDKVTLTPLISTLVLSINCQPSSSCMSTTNTALTGNPRQITIQNTGSISAKNVVVNTSKLPEGTRISSNTCTGTLNAHSTCTIALTPGSITSSDLNSTACTSGTQPVASTVTVTADGGLSSQVNVYILGYGCQYQGGFLYSVNDSYTDYPQTGSIGGKLASLVDQAEPAIGSGAQTTSVIWSSNGNSAANADVNYVSILGIDENSTYLVPSPTAPEYPIETRAYTACNGNSDGACDTSNIVSYYNFNRVSGGSAPTPLTYYASGLCKATINGYADWYLPAICEMDAVTGNVTNCPVGMQSMVGGLSFLLGNPGSAKPSISCTPPSGTNCLAGVYWSSTEVEIFPQFFAWLENFSDSGSVQNNRRKAGLFGVRCSRALTHV